MIMFGYAAGMRRGELAALDRADLADDPDGIRALLRGAKGDANHTGQLIGVAFGPTERLCPVRALRAWLDACAELAGPVFRPVDRHDNIGPRRLSGQAIADILKRRARAAGLDPATVAGHSLRSGHATGAARAGEELTRIQKQLRHRRIDTTAGYVQTANIVRESSSRHLWDDLAGPPDVQTG
jgi:integrase